MEKAGLKSSGLAAQEAQVLSSALPLIIRVNRNASLLGLIVLICMRELV